MAVAEYKVSRGLQKVFIGTLALSFAAQQGLSFYNIFLQSPSNQHLSAFFGFIAEQFLIPVVFLMAAYVLTPRNIPQLAKLFESFVITVVGVCVLQLVLMAFVYLQNLWITADSDPDALQLWVGFGVAILYIGALVLVRNRATGKK